jgi:hypothetical protein
MFGRLVYSIASEILLWASMRSARRHSGRPRG